MSASLTKKVNTLLKKVHLQTNSDFLEVAIPDEVQTPIAFMEALSSQVQAAIENLPNLTYLPTSSSPVKIA